MPKPASPPGLDHFPIENFPVDKIPAHALANMDGPIVDILPLELSLGMVPLYNSDINRDRVPDKAAFDLDTATQISIPNLTDFSVADLFFLQGSLYYPAFAKTDILYGIDIDDLTRGILQDNAFLESMGGPFRIATAYAQEGNTFLFTTAEGRVFAIGNVERHDNDTMAAADDFMTFSYVEVTHLLQDFNYL